MTTVIIAECMRENVLAGPPRANYSNGPRSSVRLSVCHTRISPKLSEIDVWLLENSNRNLGFPIQNLPSEVRFGHFGCFLVGTSSIQTEMGSWPSEWISGNSH